MTECRPSVLCPQRSLKSLQRLELIGCEVTSLDDYRASVFDMLPQIVYLDGYDPEDNEAPDSEEEDGEGRAGTGSRWTRRPCITFTFRPLQ